MHRLTATGWHLPSASTEVGVELIQSRHEHHQHQLRSIELHAQRRRKEREQTKGKGKRKSSPSAPSASSSSSSPLVSTCYPSHPSHHPYQPTPARTYSHLAHRRKKELTQFEETARIEHENLLLLQRFRTIIARKQIDNIPSTCNAPKSLNREQRRRELVAISQENARIARRLQSTRNVIQIRTSKNDTKLSSVNGMERSSAENDEIIRRHCQFPFQDPLTFQQSYYVDPENPYKNWMGGKERIYAQPHQHEEEKQASFHHSTSHPSPPPSSRHHRYRSVGCSPSPTRPQSSLGIRRPLRPQSAVSVSLSSSTRPQSAILTLDANPSVTSQDPILLSARRYLDGATKRRFIPLKKEAEQSLQQTQQTLTSDESSSTPSPSPPLLSTRRPIRPQTAAPQQKRAVNVTSMQVSTLNSLSPASDTSSILPLLPSSSTCSNSLPPSLPLLPSPPPPVLLFNGPSIVSGRFFHLKFYECSHPWRITIECRQIGSKEDQTNVSTSQQRQLNHNDLTLNDLTDHVHEDEHEDSDAEPIWDISIPFARLKPFFLSYPQLFSPSDPTKSGLVSILKDSLILIPRNDPPNSVDPDDSNSPLSSSYQLALDLIQPPPPILRTIQPTVRPGSAHRRHEEAKRERLAEMARIEKEKYMPKTKTIIQPRQMTTAPTSSQHPQQQRQQVSASSSSSSSSSTASSQLAGNQSHSNAIFSPTGEFVSSSNEPVGPSSSPLCVSTALHVSTIADIIEQIDQTPSETFAPHNQEGNTIADDSHFSHANCTMRYGSENSRHSMDEVDEIVSTESPSPTPMVESVNPIPRTDLVSASFPSSDSYQIILPSRAQQRFHLAFKPQPQQHFEPLYSNMPTDPHDTKEGTHTSMADEIQTQLSPRSNSIERVSSIDLHRLPSLPPSMTASPRLKHELKELPPLPPSPLLSPPSSMSSSQLHQLLHSYDLDLSRLPPLPSSNTASV